MSKFEKGRKKTGGRKKQTALTRLYKKYQDDFFAHYRKNGAKAIELLFKEKPDEYLKRAEVLLRNYINADAPNPGDSKKLEIGWREAPYEAIRRVIVTPPPDDDPPRPTKKAEPPTPLRIVQNDPPLALPPPSPPPAARPAAAKPKSNFHRPLHYQKMSVA